MNDAGTSKYDNRGTAQAWLLTANNGGTSKYDNKGTAEAFIGTSAVSTTSPKRTLLGIGL